MRRAAALALALLISGCTFERPPYGPRSESGETAQATTVGEVTGLLSERGIDCGPVEGSPDPASRFASGSRLCALDPETRYAVFVFDDEGLTRNWLDEVSRQRVPSEGGCYLLGPRWAIQMTAQRIPFQDALGGAWAEHRSSGCVR